MRWPPLRALLSRRGQQRRAVTSGQFCGLQHLPRFALEKLPGWEAAEHDLCASDVEPLSLTELLALGEDQGGDARERWENLSLGYPASTQGDGALREEVAGGVYGGALTADEVLGVAPSEGILLAMHALLTPGDHVVAMNPGYGSLSAVATHALGCDVTPWEAEWRPTGGPHDGYGEQVTFDVGRLRSLITPKTKLVVVNFPHNPTGFVPLQHEWEDLVDLCASKGLYLFCDEMYRHLEPAGTRTLPAACTLAYGRGVSLGGLSKAYGLAGLRVGWLATRDASVLGRCHELKDYTTICAGSPNECLGLMALRSREKLWARANTIIAANTALLEVGTPHANGDRKERHAAVCI
jgi:aspartate/methionine/tyrosine aminotransferase